MSNDEWARIAIREMLVRVRRLCRIEYRRMALELRR